MQNKQGSPLRYALDDWPPLSRTVLLGLQWAAIVIPSIIILGHVIASLQFAEPVSQTPYLQKLFIVTAVTLVIQVLWGHRLPLIAGPATVLLIGVIASQGFSPAAIAFLGGVPSVIVGCVMLYILTSQIAAGLLVANQERVFQFEDGLVIGLPVLLGTVIAILPDDVLTTFPVVLRPVLGNGFVVGTVGAFLLDRTMFRA